MLLFGEAGKEVSGGGGTWEFLGWGEGRGGGQSILAWVLLFPGLMGREDSWSGPSEGERQTNGRAERGWKRRMS